MTNLLNQPAVLKTICSVKLFLVLFLFWSCPVFSQEQDQAVTVLHSTSTSDAPQQITADESYDWSSDVSCCSPAIANCQIRKSRFSDSKRINFYGWIQAGFTANEHGNKTTYQSALKSPASRNMDALSGNSYLLGTEQQTDLKLSQLWIGLNRVIDVEHGIDWGFQYDMTYGTDGRYCQPFGDQTLDFDWGSGDYYLGITQMYVEMGNSRLKLRAGKFVTEMSHEPLAAPFTFFYSHSYACYSSPLTASGAMMQYAPTDKLTFWGGWTAGYHTSLGSRFKDNGFLGRCIYKPTNRLQCSYSLYTGVNNGWNQRGDAHEYARFYDTSDVLAQTVILSMELTDRFRYMIEGHWSRYEDKNSGMPNHRTNAQGISQHFIYQINPKWSIGTRFEWLKHEGTMFDAMPFSGGEGGNVYEMTLGANWNPTPWFNLRPELRYDWTYYHNGFTPFAGGTKDYQLTGGCAATIKF